MKPLGPQRLLRQPRLWPRLWLESKRPMSQPMRSLRADTRPLYIQAVDALYELIEDGVYQAGQSLPAEAELAVRLGVSRSTIREALSHLEKDGLIVRKQGVGTFIAPRSVQISGGLERLASFRSVVELSGAAVQVVSRTVRLIEADTTTAATLQIPPGSEIVQVQTVEAVDGCRLADLEGLIVPELVDMAQLAADEGSLLEHLYRQANPLVAYSRTAIYAIGASRDLADRLGVAEGRAILHLAETVYSDADAPIALFRNYFVTDSYNYKIVRRIVRRIVEPGPFGLAAQRGA